MHAMVKNLPRWVMWVASALAIILMALALTWVSPKFGGVNIQGWISYLVVLLIGTGILLGGWCIIQKTASAPAWLGALLVGATVLRLAAGVLWTIVIPLGGYDSPVEQAGYVMKDAYNRDIAAWKLARSGEPLWSAYTKYNQADQYGGMLMLSATIYRFLGGEVHQPLKIVVITAAFSSLSILFGWGFARRLWDDRVAALTAWGLALYPDAVLLGSSQMREAFMITLTALAFYGLLGYRLDHAKSGMAWMFVGLMLSLVFSPPFTVLLLVALSLVALALDDWRLLRRKQLWLVLGALALLAGLGVWLTWGHIAPKGISNLWDLVHWWMRKAAAYQSFLTQHASGWLQREFRHLPEWQQLPVLVFYGIVQPFLPATLVALGAPAWRGIAIWRAIGWTLLLLVLCYASLRSLYQPIAFRLQKDKTRIQQKSTPTVMVTLTVLVWILIIVASLRGGGDQWDNPRYRAIFTCLQVAMAAWVIVEQQRSAGPWFKRILVGAGFVLAWFLPWYVRRYTGFHWDVISVYKTIGLGLASAALYVIWDWVRSTTDRHG